MTDLIIVLAGGVALAVCAFLGGVLLYLAAVWLHYHRPRRGLYNHYSKWVEQKAAEMEANAKRDDGTARL